MNAGRTGFLARFGVFALVCALSGFFLTPRMGYAQDRDTFEPAGEPYGVATDSLGENTDPIDDEEITAAIESELTSARGLSRDSIDVSTQNGIVTLSGSTSILLAKDRALRIAESLKGVRAVVNNLTVQPPSRPDEDVLDDVKTALAEDPATDAYEVAVTVDDGTVTLTGTVDSWQESRLADKIARSVNGVKAVENQIGITYAERRPDDEIQDDIEQTLMWDARIDDALIGVAVQDGEVTLSGHVGSAYERSLATTKAWVNGVQSVNFDDLEVAWWAREQMRREDRFADKTDADLSAAVERALLQDPRVAAFNVDVEVQNGVATLSGTVDNLKAKRAAAADARNTFGVWQVQNELTISPDYSEVSDARSAATRDTTAAMAGDPMSDDTTYTVEDTFADTPADTPDETFAERDTSVAAVDTTYTAEETFAERDTSVADTFDDTQVAERDTAHMAADTALTTRDTTAAPGDRTGALTERRQPDEGAPETGQSEDAAGPDDQRIAQKVGAALLFDPYVEKYELSVSVEDGTATLSGTVDSHFEKWQAEDIASRVQGVTDIENNIFVPYDPLAYDVTFYDWDPVVSDYDYRYDYDASSMPDDAVLQQDVVSHLYWSPIVDEDEVNVTVTDGTVTLTGTVDTWYEKNAATDEAFEAGATIVENELDVGYGPSTSM